MHCLKGYSDPTIYMTSKRLYAALAGVLLLWSVTIAQAQTIPDSIDVGDLNTLDSAPRPSNVQAVLNANRTVTFALTPVDTTALASNTQLLGYYLTPR